MTFEPCEEMCFSSKIQYAVKNPEWEMAWDVPLPNCLLQQWLTNQPINSVASFPGRLLLHFLDGIHDFESCMQSIMQSGRWPGNKAIGTYVIDSESEEAAASMLGTPMGSEIECCCPCEVRLEVDVIPHFLSTTVLFFGSLLVRHRL